MQAFEGIRDNRVDAVVTISGFPNPSIAGLASAMGLGLLEISNDVRAKVRGSAPFYDDAVIPAGTYEGVDEDVQTLAVAAQWLVSSEVDEELVYQITRSLWNDTTREFLDEAHAKGREIRLETALDAINIPLHEGPSAITGKSANARIDEQMNGPAPFVREAGRARRRLAVQAKGFGCSRSGTRGTQTSPFIGSSARVRSGRFGRVPRSEPGSGHWVRAPAR